MGFIEWFEAGGLLAVGALAYTALSLIGQVVGMIDGPDPNDRTSKAIAIVDKFKGFLRMVGIGARYKNEGPAPGIMPGQRDTGERVVTTKSIK